MLDYGEKIAEGIPAEIQREPARDRGLPRHRRRGGGQGVSSVREPLAAGEPLLEVEKLRTAYGHIHALKGVSLEVRDGEIVTLIGANGAGKTTRCSRSPA